MPRIRLRTLTAGVRAADNREIMLRVTGLTCAGLLLGACFDPTAVGDTDTETDSGSATGSGTNGPGNDGSPTTADSTATPGDDGTPTTDDGPEDDSDSGPDTGSDTGVAGTCGDGRRDPGEECDDANEADDDACLSTCVAATCGDGFVQAGREACDGAVPNGQCSDDCMAVASCDGTFADCDGMPDTGCEADLQSESLHCGYCGHDCGDTACSEALCEPTVLASGLNPVQEMTLGPANVFVSTNLNCCTGGAITRLDKIDGGAFTVASSLNVPRGMVVNGANLVWSSSNIGDFFTVPIAGGNSVLLADITANGIVDIVRNATHIFYVKSSGLAAPAAAARLLINGTGPVEDLDGSGFATAIDVDNAHAFWIRGSSVMQSGLDGSNVITLASPAMTPLDIAAGGDGRVYFTVSSGVVAADVDDGNPTILADLGAATGKIVMQDGVLYVGTTGTGEVHRVLPEDGSTIPLATGLSSIVALRADDESVFFATSDTVYRVAH